MKLLLSFGLILSFLGTGVFGQSLGDRTVPIGVDANYPGPGIKFILSRPLGAPFIVRRSNFINRRTRILQTLTSSQTVYIDSTGYPQMAYQYSLNGINNMYVKVRHTPRPSEGRVIVLVQDTLLARLRPEIDQTLEDMRLDGWQPILLSASPTDSVKGIKARILEEFYKDTIRTKAVFIIGFVPIPYSGGINPDGHADHYGAWPADVYYADVAGRWTDVRQITNGTGTSITTVQNVAGDGKFDQSFTPANGRIRLGVGRIVFNALPVYQQQNPAWNDVELTRRYLQKLHLYKVGGRKTPSQMIFQDTFFPFNPNRTEALGDWLDARGMVGDQAFNGTILGGAAGANSRRYLLGYMSGPGDWHAVGNVATAAQIAASDSVNIVFAKAFGSYFGDWFLPNNFMRALVASKGGVLSCSWSGRPNHYYGSMSIGEPLATVARQMHGDLGDSSRISGQSIHSAIIGDVTLHLKYIKPATNATATLGPNKTIQLRWSPSADVCNGYYIYRAQGPNDLYHPITQTPIVGVSYTDSAPLAGENTYMVRAVRLEVGWNGYLPVIALGARTNTIQIDRSLTWTGNVSSDWNDSLNWQPRKVPTELDTLTVRAGVPHQPTLAGFGEARSIHLGVGAQLRIEGTLQLSGHALGRGNLVVPGTLAFRNGARFHLLGVGDSMTFSNLVVDDPLGLRITQPLGITRQLDITNGALDLDSLPATLVATPTFTARLGRVGDRGNILNAHRFVIEQYLPPPPVGKPGLWHLLTPLMRGSPTYLFEENNPLALTTYNGVQSDTSSIYFFNTDSNGVDSLSNFNKLGWGKRSFPSANYPLGVGHRVWVEANTHFSAQGPSKMYHRGKPIFGNTVRTNYSSTPGILMGYSDTTTYGNIRLYGNPYPSPIVTSEFDSSWNQASAVYQYNPLSNTYGIYAKGVGAVQGGSPIVPAGGAYFLEENAQPVFTERLKYLVDTLPNLPSGGDNGLARLHILLKDTATQSEVLLGVYDTLTESTHSYAFQLRTGNPLLGLFRSWFSENHNAIMLVDSAANQDDSTWLVTESLSNIPTKLIFKDEGVLATYAYYLHDKLTNTTRRLGPGNDSADVVYQPGLKRQYALVRFPAPLATKYSQKGPKFILAPNPATSQLSITNAVPGYITLQNTLGQTVHKQWVGAGTELISVLGLPAGFYTADLNGYRLRWVKQ